MIYTKDLRKKFGEHEVLCGITQHIEKGEKVVVIGPSGSGKSTFLRCLNMLEEPTGGEIIFEGVKLTDPQTNLDRSAGQGGQLSGDALRRAAAKNRNCQGAGHGSGCDAFR